LPVPLIVPAVVVQLYIAPLPLPEAVNTTSVFIQTVAADIRVTVGGSGNALTVAVAALEVPDRQITSPYATSANAVTDLAPVVAPLTVNVPLPVPLAVPAVPPHVYVAPLPLPEAVNSTSVFIQTVPADIRITEGVAGTATKPVTVPEGADWQVTVPYATCANAVTDLVPVVAPLTV
jgi:hypothetical protein